MIEISLPGWFSLSFSFIVGIFGLMYFLMQPDRKPCTCKADLTGKTVIVTGANTGIGFHTAQDLAARNARVILACRSNTRGEAARDKIIASSGNKNVVVRELNLGSLGSVRQFAEDIVRDEERLDILINNAGAAGLPNVPTEDGLELNFAVNYFGHFLLTCLLLDLLKKSVPSRIINVSSAAQKYAPGGWLDVEVLQGKRAYYTFLIYSATKLANLLFTRELAQHMNGTGVTTYCVHPGRVKTEIARKAPSVIRKLFQFIVIFLKTGEEGAQTTIHCAVSEAVKEESGKYYIDRAPAETSRFINPLAEEPALAQKLWEISEHLTGLK